MSASAQAPVPVSAAIPALFVSHGAPLFALDAGTTGPALTQWGQSLKSQYPGLRGVVIMSPHWMARSAQVMTGPQPATWHDFGGFPAALYQLQYPAPAHPRWRRRCWACCKPLAWPPKVTPHAPLTMAPGCR